MFDKAKKTSNNLYTLTYICESENTNLIIWEVQWKM